MELITGRLILRPWRDEDAEELYQYAKDPDIGPIAGWPPHTSVENSLEIIRGILSQPETYAVVLKETDRPIGSVGIMFGDHGSAQMQADEAEIGYWIGKPYWGQGFIPEAVKELQRHCFEDLGCNTVWCGYYDGNEKSKRVQEKCWFVYHHMTKNCLCELMGDVRTEHFTCLTKTMWEKFTKILLGLQNKNDTLAYRLYLKLAELSAGSDELYPLFDDMANLLTHKSSFVRVRGFRLCCMQIKWDKDHRWERQEEKLLRILNDDKPTAVRQALSQLKQVIEDRPELYEIVNRKIKEIDLDHYSESMRPVIEKDISILQKEWRNQAVCTASSNRLKS